MANIVYLDLETADAARLWDYGPDFIRLAGYALGDGEVVTTTDIASVVEVIDHADLVVGHNVLGFDLLALELYHGLDLARLVEADRVVDTLLIARQNDPPLSGKADLRRYNLEAVCRRVFNGGKVASANGSALESLAKDHGGYDKIPVDHPDYVRYLVQDVGLVRELAGHLVIDGYLWREHKIMWRLNHISRHGFLVDVDLVTRLVAQREARIQKQKVFLHYEYGLPLEGKKPHTTTAGRASLEKAFAQLGIEPPRTEKGALATGKAALEKLEGQHTGNEALVALCQALRSFNGDRSMAQTLLDHTSADGRIHPAVSAGQATGRVSVTKPGLTVLGKRDRSNICERAMLLPDKGHVLIGADLSQIDARAIAIHAQDADYIAALEPGKDLHSEMAAAVFGGEDWDRGSGQHPRRADAKAITHATTYGMGAAGLAQNAGISEDAARRQLATLDAQFPALAGFKRQIREEGKKQVIRNAFGRRMRVAPGKEYTQAPAHIGQGTARDLMMEGILRLPVWLLPFLRAVVHDEVVLSVPEDQADTAEAALLNALTFTYQTTPEATPVPILADSSDRGRDWADCYRTEKSVWPEVSRAHRERAGCADLECTWHTETELER